MNTNTNSNSSSLAPVHCSALCSRPAVAKLKVTAKISLPMCADCRELIDRDHKYAFIEFDEEDCFT